MIKVTGTIGTYQEYSLHEALKNSYKSANGNIEVKIENYIIDVVNGKQLIEIQTRNFSQIRDKLENLLQLQYSVILVHPIFEEKLLKTRIDDKISIRTSPKKENLFQMFDELVFISDLFRYPNFSFEIVFTKVEITRNRIKPNKYKVADKRLIEVSGKKTFKRPEDFLFIIPYELQQKLTTRSLMTRLGIKYSLASKMVYFLNKIDVIKQIQKEGNLKIYAVKNDNTK